MKTIYVTSIVSLLLVFSLNQQGLAQNENLRFEHIGFEEGLSNEIATSVLQDSKGYLWFGTTDGLNSMMVILLLSTSSNHLILTLFLRIGYIQFSRIGMGLMENVAGNRSRKFIFINIEKRYSWLKINNYLFQPFYLKAKNN